MLERLAGYVVFIRGCIRVSTSTDEPEAIVNVLNSLT